MNNIISELYKIIHQTGNLIEFEESVRLFMYDVFSDKLGEIFTKLNKVIVREKQSLGWTVEKNDSRGVQFTFGWVTYTRTLMHDLNGEPHYPFDEWIGFKKHRRRSPFVEVKVAEMASENTYRETARNLSEWTAVNISHTTVGTILKQVGEAQAKADEDMVHELEESAELPKGEKVDFLYAEADGVFVRRTKRKKSHEVHHAVTYEGWNKNGNRVSLKHPKVMMTTKPLDTFWKVVQAGTAHQYSLEDTQVITNSDGGMGYTADKFQEAFSQSNYPVMNQLDAYHIYQGLNRAFGARESQYKPKVKKALKAHEWEDFVMWMDTYESTLDDSKKEKKLEEFRTYITRNWDRIIDWREQLTDIPDDARGLGAMESNQRHVTYRMKKRGMHWSSEGSEAMVKVKQGILNGTLREVYLRDQKRSVRKQRDVKKKVNMARILQQRTRPSIGAKQGSIALSDAQSTATGNLKKLLR